MFKVSKKTFISLKCIQYLFLFFLDTGISKIADEMQVVVGRIIDEFPEKVSNSKLQIPVINEDSMIPTKENDLNYLKNSQENVGKN